MHTNALLARVLRFLCALYPANRKKLNRWIVLYFGVIAARPAA